jgi:AAA+ superfamily predicted ATPase
MLFEAYREGNDLAFLRAAETIIAEELASNHHHAATELQRALGRGREQMNASVRALELAASPKDRRSGEDLLWIHESSITPQRVVLAKGTAKKITRVLDEHRGKVQLQKHGYNPKTKLLFWGPPGTGKTLTAHLLAYELGLPVAVLRLNTVISSFLGDTAAHLQRVFNRASSTPMVLLLDEFDAIGKNRDDPHDVGELKRVVNSLLQAIDGFHGNQSILVAASNHQYLLDPGLWRRFDEIVQFPLPEFGEREKFLSLLLGGIKSDSPMAQIARKAARLSYAEIEHVVTESLKTMVLEGRDSLRVRDITEDLRAWRSSIADARRRNGVKTK